MVTRHRAMADEPKRTSRNLGAAPPDQKPARPASEVVRDPVHHSPTDGKQQSRLGLATLTRDGSITASSRLQAVGVTAPHHFYDGFDAVLARRR